MEMTDIIFRMNKSNLYAVCDAKGDGTLNCSITKLGTSCPIEDQDGDISIGTEEPNYQILDENIIIYFSGFANKSTLTIIATNISEK